MKILVTGGNGEFCKHLVRVGKEHSFITPHKQGMYPGLDVRDYWNVDYYFRKRENDFDYVIHAGAVTRPMVIHEDNPTLSIKTNIVGTANVVMACEKYKKKIIYISTDYVYDGISGNFKETDCMKPFTKYGWSKLGGECAVQMYDNHLILRMAMKEESTCFKNSWSEVLLSVICMYLIILVPVGTVIYLLPIVVSDVA